jgi:hypothetical protein
MIYGMKNVIFMLSKSKDEIRRRRMRKFMENVSSMI